MYGLVIQLKKCRFHAEQVVSIVPGRTRSYSDAPNEEYEGHGSRRNTHLY